MVGPTLDDFVLEKTFVVFQKKKKSLVEHLEEAPRLVGMWLREALLAGTAEVARVDLLQHHRQPGLVVRRVLAVSVRSWTNDHNAMVFKNTTTESFIHSDLVLIGRTSVLITGYYYYYHYVWQPSKQR